MSINYVDGLIVSSWAHYFNSYSGEHPIVWRSQAYRLVFESVGVKMRVQVRKSGVGLAFLMLELDMSLLFYRLAKSSSSKARSERRMEMAHKAYQAAVYFVERVNLTSAEREAFETSRGKVEEALYGEKWRTLRKSRNKNSYSPVGE